MKNRKWMAALLLSLLLAIQLPGEHTLAENDTIPPATPVVDAVSDTAIIITGKAESKAKIYAFVGNDKIGEAKAQNGQFSIAIAKQKIGANIKVYAVDAAKNKSKSKIVKVVDTPRAVQYAATGNVNMRSGASISDQILAVLPKGTIVSYISKTNSWYKVKTGKHTGFVNAAYLKKASSSKPESFPAPSIKKTGTYVNGVLLVNKLYGLPSSYNPGIDATAQKGADAMVAAAKQQGISLNPFSTFRSYSRQATLFANYSSKYGKAEAEKFSARPGHSEHQSGLAFDFGGVDQTQWLKESFGETEEGKWLRKNAHTYGFILRYPKGQEKVTGYQYEPWHYRYVGSALAAKVKASGKTLEEYLLVE
ncbi:D-alanyl-D-alanine carboxypeptidase family protein [Planomicrobium sp. CPCC 101079]|uniref:D-alanyl-D-alanine carboxypeptidase family protein n=1 Tax=Planomicrobium sp. CPCC 101079 TaxID=2599618 RepID=UPI0011B8232E|nr:D-alanyl-D-alanine carboxypeptidase family protein [Planomicrobium sp. CPCC 101079]TWT03719.1 SH3 domain-containing protein [Planomicrobium sp. CPCC 101079]